MDSDADPIGGAPAPDRVVVVSAGTYHLPFDRLSRWMEAWFADRQGVQIVFQHGPSTPMANAQNFEILPYQELLRLCRSADIVVLQGGAGGVMDMRSIGVIPVVVPRVPGGGEVVDDHQLVFCREMQRLGLVECVETYEELVQSLDKRLSDSKVKSGAQPLVMPGVGVVSSVLAAPLPHASLIRSTRRLVVYWSKIFGEMAGSAMRHRGRKIGGGRGGPSHFSDAARDGG